MRDTTTDSLDSRDMQRLAAGTDDALNSLMERHAQGIYQFLLRVLGNEDDANDLAQETFVRVYRSRERYQAGQTFSSWLYTIAANLARNHIRWRTRHPNISMDAERQETGSTIRDSLPAEGAHPGQATEKQELAAAVREAVLRLPEDLREAIVLCEWEEMSMAEAAAVLETTVKAVESRLYRARKLLRDELADWMD